MSNIEHQLESREEIFGPLTPGRECGECTACCTYTAIDTPELTKEPGVTCEHCTSTGCGIYLERFPVCRNWQCLWKHIPTMPQEVRPDLSGVMCVLDQPAAPANALTRSYVRLMVIDPLAAESADLLPSIIAMFSQGDLPVWLDEIDGELTLLHPQKEIADVVLNNNSGSSAATLNAAQSWLSGVRITTEPGPS